MNSTSEANDFPRLTHSCLRNLSSGTYFRQPQNLPTSARRNWKCTECGATVFGRNWVSAKSAHLSTFGAETEADIQSTSSYITIIIFNNNMTDDESHCCECLECRQYRCLIRYFMQ